MIYVVMEDNDITEVHRPLCAHLTEEAARAHVLALEQAEKDKEKPSQLLREWESANPLPKMERWVGFKVPPKGHVEALERKNWVIWEEHDAARKAEMERIRALYPGAEFYSLRPSDYSILPIELRGGEA